MANILKCLIFFTQTLVWQFSGLAVWYFAVSQPQAFESSLCLVIPGLRIWHFSSFAIARQFGSSAVSEFGSLGVRQFSSAQFCSFPVAVVQQFCCSLGVRQFKSSAVWQFGSLAQFFAIWHLVRQSSAFVWEQFSNFGILVGLPNCAELRKTAPNQMPNFAEPNAELRQTAPNKMPNCTKLCQTKCRTAPNQMLNCAEMC